MIYHEFKILNSNLEIDRLAQQSKLKEEEELPNQVNVEKPEVTSTLTKRIIRTTDNEKPEPTLEENSVGQMPLEANSTTKID